MATNRKTGSGTVERFSPDATGSIVDSTGKLWHIDGIDQIEDGPIAVGDEVKFNVKDGIAEQIRQR